MRVIPSGLNSIENCLRKKQETTNANDGKQMIPEHLAFVIMQ